MQVHEEKKTTRAYKKKSRVTPTTVDTATPEAPATPPDTPQVTAIPLPEISIPYEDDDEDDDDEEYF